MHTLFEVQAARTPGAVAVDFGETQLTYRALDRRANRLARLLQRKGVTPDARVGILMERSVGFVVAVLGALKAGGCYVPLDPAYPAARLALMLEEARATALLTHRRMVEALPPHDATIVCLDKNGEAENRAAPVVGGVTPDHLAYVLFTSGSTGRPKGVAMPHRPLVNLITWQRERSTLGAGARTLQFSALSFDVSFQEIFATLSTGGCLVLVPERVRQDPTALLHWICDKRVERLFLPFVALQHLAEIAAACDLYPPSLREVITAGEQLKTVPAVVRFFQELPGCSLENQYGPTESHVVTAYRLPDAPEDWETLPPIGQPIANATIHLLDDTLTPVPDGDIGELYIGGVSLARGYLDQPERTAERFIDDPFRNNPNARLYRTGDLARRRPDGLLTFRGRADRQVKVRGYRIELGELEAALNHHADVREAVVRVDENGADGRKRLVAYVVAREGATLNAIALRAHMADRLPEHMVPAAYVAMDAFPLTPSGKTDRGALPTPDDDSRALLQADYVPPRDELEETLVAVWEDALGFAPVGIRDDFFNLGGYSILAAEMFVELGARFGRDLPLALLAENPTIEALADVLRDKREAANAWSSLVPIQPHGAKTPFFCIHGGEGNVVSFRTLSKGVGEDQPFYGLQWGGLDGGAGRTTIEDMADDYLWEIRTVQPHGPYLLGGHCVGGLVARKIAQRLRAAGEAVPLLVMIDAPNFDSEHFEPLSRLQELALDYPGGFKERMNVLRSKLALRSRLIIWTHRLTGREGTPAYREARAALDQEGQPSWLDEQGRRLYIRMCRLLGKEIPPAYRPLYAMLSVSKAARTYQPTPYPGRAVHFHAGTTRTYGAFTAGLFHDERLGWSSTTDAPEYHRIPSGHNSIVVDPRLAERLGACLQEAHGAIAEKERPQVNAAP